MSDPELSEKVAAVDRELARLYQRATTSDDELVAALDWVQIDTLLEHRYALTADSD